MTSRPNKDAERPSVIVTPGDGLPVFDPHIQSFLDRHVEAVRFDDKAPLPAATASRPRTFQPAGGGNTATMLLYLHVPVSGARAATPDEAVQSIADAAGVALVLQTVSMAAGLAAIDLTIVAALEDMRGIAPNGTILLGGDDIGGLIAVSFASRPISAPFSLALLILATPLLGWPDGSGGTAWLSAEAAEDRARLAEHALDDGGWPVSYREDRLQRLPPLLILTAEVDPFRSSAEVFARRILAAEQDASAVNTLGGIHDFVWLPDLLDARCTKAAHALIVDALRSHGAGREGI